MALDRTWYNTLVDDDGSNTVGSPIDKADIDALMDAVDAALAVGGGTAFKNRVINGDFSFDQRNLGVSTATADDVYCHDRWYALTQTAAVNVSQQALQETGQPFNIRLTQNQAAAQRMGLAQILEARVSQADRGQAVMLSARVRCSASQAIRYAILEWTGTADAVTSDVVNDWTSATYTASNFFLAASVTVTAVGTITPSAATWTALTLAGTLGASTNNLVVLFWTEGTAAQNVTLDVGLVQLERGTGATSFEYLPPTVTKALCQRYYWKVTTAFAAGDLVPISSGVVVSTTSVFVCVKHPVAMRAAPTFAQSGSTLYDATVNPAVTSIGVGYFSEDFTGINMNATGGGLTVGRAANWILAAGAGVFVSASSEL